jgi:ABC-2 type transport system ATP-binding protein
VIHIESLSFRYPGSESDALHGLSLRVKPGSLFGLLGPNGSGKTTLISILSGLLSPSAGQLRIDDRALPAATREVQHFTALVPQEHAFYPRLGVLENLKFFAGALAIPPSDRRARIDESIAVNGLEGFTTVRAEHLSGGLKRRLNLAIGLLNRPRLLFLDEPTVGMDPQSRRFILDAIKRINATGTTVLYTSHYMEEVEMLCNEIGVLDQGRLLACGTLSELLDDAERQRLTVSLRSVPTAEQQRALGAVTGLAIAGNELRMEDCDAEGVKRVMALLDAQKLGISRVKYGYGDLEELFLHLTGRQLRD